MRKQRRISWGRKQSRQETVVWETWAVAWVQPLGSNEEEAIFVLLIVIDFVGLTTLQFEIYFLLIVIAYTERFLIIKFTWWGSYILKTILDTSLSRQSILALRRSHPSLALNLFRFTRPSLKQSLKMFLLNPLLDIKLSISLYSILFKSSAINLPMLESLYLVCIWDKYHFLSTFNFWIYSGLTMRRCSNSIGLKS